MTVRLLSLTSLVQREVPPDLRTYRHRWYSCKQFKTTENDKHGLISQETVVIVAPMKKLLLSLTAVAFAFAVQAGGDQCAAGAQTAKSSCCPSTQQTSKQAACPTQKETVQTSKTDACCKETVKTSATTKPAACPAQKETVQTAKSDACCKETLKTSASKKPAPAAKKQESPKTAK